MPLDRSLIRLGITAFQLARRAYWRVTKPIALGVHAVALTVSGDVVLVRLTYSTGWRLPGGGRKKGETAREGMLRELREEIGLRRYDSIEQVQQFAHRPEHRRGLTTLFLLRGVAFEAKQSIEIEEVRAFAPKRLPVDTTPLTRRLIEIALEPQRRRSGEEGIVDLSEFER